MEEINVKNPEQVLAACLNSLQQGRKCQLGLTRQVVQSELFQDWIERLYGQYPASQIKQQLRFVDGGDAQVRETLNRLVQTAALKQLSRKSARC